VHYWLALGTKLKCTILTVSRCACHECAYRKVRAHLQRLLRLYPCACCSPLPSSESLAVALPLCLLQATARHFADLRARYGDPLIVLNLLKSHERRPREMLLRQELSTAIQLLNSKVSCTWQWCQADGSL
jgi:hypothetical protein